MSDPTADTALARARDYLTRKPPLDWLEIQRERERAERIHDLNTQREIRELIAREPQWRWA